MFLDHESESYVWNSLFEGNIALNGGVAALRSSDLFSQNNTFRNNDARIGGVLSIGTESIATCEDDIFLGNNAADSGGVMLIDQASFANLTR
jgi:pectate lyase